MTSRYFAIIEYTVELTISDYYKLESMWAVPVLVDGSSQTELKHPKNVYTQYEPRVFTNEEVAKIWESNEMQKFLSKAEGV